jgi:hypothetical protein
MTPIEFWWLYPKPQEPTGGMSQEWVKWAKEKYPDKRKIDG